MDFLEVIVTSKYSLYKANKHFMEVLDDLIFFKISGILVEYFKFERLSHNYFVRALFLIGITLFPNYIFSQTVNGYANVTSISSTTILVNNVDESNDSFEDGQKIIIMQMQDDVIGSNTLDDLNFGLLGSIQSAGLYEVQTIQSHTETAGLPTSITVNGSLENSYSIGANSSLQILTFPQFGSPDYTNANITCKSWDGTTGGVIAFEVSGTLTVGGDINANNAGFRGASLNAGNSTGCTGTSNYRVSFGAHHADKGEGIYRNNNANFVAGRARILNGGGGGNSHNAGGGGGGNYSAGGTGGPGWPNCSPSAGGMGGIELNTYISASRIFLGGGGGAGEGNNGGSQNAGNGGGIILIKAGAIATSGTCGNYAISANGQSVTTGSGNDGNSGGGAGGSIIIEVDNWNIIAACPLIVEANGGKGGDVTHTHAHGAGGGGGQGLVLYSILEPTLNTITNTTNGTGGLNCSTCGVADSGSGPDNTGIIDEISGPLPIELLNFYASVTNNNGVNLNWQTASETNNDFFTIERSPNGLDWSEIINIEGAGNSSLTLSYSAHDNYPLFGTSYYRLKQTDFDGQFSYSQIKVVFIHGIENHYINIYPNPTNGYLTIEADKTELESLRVYTGLGKDVTSNIRIVEMGEMKINISLAGLNTGIYYCRTKTMAQKIFLK